MQYLKGKLEAVNRKRGDNTIQYNTIQYNTKKDKHINNEPQNTTQKTKD